MLLLIWFGRILQIIIRLLFHRSGGTWPGHIILKIYPSFLSKSLALLPEGVILVTGTNGKTTTTALISHLFKKSGKKVLSNETGANLLNGIASSALSIFDFKGRPKYQMGVFEIDENALPLLLLEVLPRQIVFLNLFRDQLDRYGEVDLIASRWEKALAKVKGVLLILNADDPTIATLARTTALPRAYFGLGIKASLSSGYHQVLDSSHCRICGHKLSYTYRYFSHLGVWSCLNCGEKSPELQQTPPQEKLLAGYYNQYNSAAALLSLSTLGYDNETTKKWLTEFVPVFGRFERIEWMGLEIVLGLAKNPTGFNEALRTMADLVGSTNCLLISLNDRIPDGRDVSWIWDVAFEELLKGWSQVLITGTRALDLALRVEYTGKKTELLCFDDVKEAFEYVRKTCDKGSTLPVLATYSAMTDIRSLLKGKALI